MHTGCWALLITYETLTARFVYKQTAPILNYAIYYAINIGFFYGVVNLWWRTASGSWSWWWDPASYILLFGTYLLLKAVADIVLNQRKDISGWTAAISYLPATIARAVYFAILVALYIVSSRISLYRRKAAEAEIAYRQQQLQPHLLFNTLNMIYNSVGRHSGEAARCVWLLSELMQYSLHPGAEHGKVAVEREIGQLYNLIEINNHRFGLGLFLDIQIDEMEEAGIIPLVLLTLTENLFKHGDLLDSNYPASLRLKRNGDRLCFTTANRVRDLGLRADKGLGLENSRIRLEYAYGRNFVLRSGRKGEYFELYLEVPI